MNIQHLKVVNLPNLSYVQMIRIIFYYTVVQTIKYNTYMLLYAYTQSYKNELQTLAIIDVDVIDNTCTCLVFSRHIKYTTYKREMA